MYEIHQIKKVGTLGCDIVKALPFVFHGTLYRFECIRKQAVPKDTFYFYSRFVNVENGKESLPVASGLEMTSAFVWENKIYIFGVKDRGYIYQMFSEDLISWSTPVCAIGAPEWGVYNGAVCRAGERFVMCMQLAEPLWFVVVPFTLFFAESTDLKKWKFNFDAVFGRQKYVDTPMFRFFDGWYYLFYMTGSYETGFEERVVRSRDLRTWIHSARNPVMQSSAEDRFILNQSISEKERKRIQSVHNLCNSDMQMAEYGGNVYMTYVWGNQKNESFLAKAMVENKTEQEFCESFFPEA